MHRTYIKDRGTLMISPVVVYTPCNVAGQRINHECKIQGRVN